MTSRIDSDLIRGLDMIYQKPACSVCECYPCECAVCVDCGERAHRDTMSKCEACDSRVCGECHDEHAEREDREADEDRQAMDREYEREITAQVRWGMQ